MDITNLPTLIIISIGDLHTDVVSHGISNENSSIIQWYLNDTWMISEWWFNVKE